MKVDCKLQGKGREEEKWWCILYMRIESCAEKIRRQQPCDVNFVIMQPNP